MIIVGQSLCPVCQKPLYNDGRLVSFTWFESSNPEVARYSDAGVHFECVTSSRFQPNLSHIYLDQLGEDGEKPNGSKTLTVSNNVRVKTRLNGVIVRHGPLLATLEMPQATAVDFVVSDFWSPNGTRSFSGKGFDSHFVSDGSISTFKFRCFPYGLDINMCAPEQLQIVERIIPERSVDIFLTELKAGFERAVDML